MQFHVKKDVFIDKNWREKDTTHLANNQVWIYK